MAREVSILGLVQHIAGLNERIVDTSLVVKDQGKSALACLLDDTC
jgi:hypothetical protein